MECMIKEWRYNKEEQGFPYLQYDNNRIQIAADLRDIGLDPSFRVPLSAYSPDLNRAIEHTFGWLKEEVRGWLYGWIQHHPGCVPTAKQFADATHGAFMGRKQAWVSADVMGLPELWEILDHDEGVQFRCSNGRWKQGSGGGWSPKTHS